MSETWLSRVSRPQPFVSVKIQASHKDYKALGFSLHTPSKSTSQTAMADTGCQSCLAGIIVLYRLGLTQADLIPVTMQMHAADNKSINFLGATLLRVPSTDATGWCHRMVICAKKNSKPRRTVDFQPLNMHAKRETHHTPSPFHQARSVPHGKKKTILDAGMGTTACPFGPQGYIASGDGYTRRYDEIVTNILDKSKSVGDALLWADTLDESFFKTIQWLDICRRHGITLNPAKFVLASDTIKFAGFEISLDKMRPSYKPSGTSQHRKTSPTSTAGLA